MKQYWRNQEILFFTILFDKEYVWLKDTDGTVYLARFVDGEVVL